MYLPEKRIALTYSENDIIFEFSATSFDRSQATLFQYYLEGNDENWSKWTTDIKKEYTNLAGGDYQFRVRSKNVYGVIGKEDIFHFTILPPFYLTWWAYLSYAFIFLFGLLIIDRVQRKRLINKERERAKIREAELIKKQAQELETIDNIVRVINKELVLENLLQVLLEQGMKLFPHIFAREKLLKPVPPGLIYETGSQPICYPRLSLAPCWYWQTKPHCSLTVYMPIY